MTRANASGYLASSKRRCEATDIGTNTPEAQLREAAAEGPLELSVVIPCRDEADTVGACVETALRAMSEAGIRGEVIVADNGSTDASQEIAKRAGACIVWVPTPGYGNALMKGIAAARGRYVVMGDADLSYDFREVPRFLGKLREGFDLVQGCRFSAGGGQALPGAMPWSHRWLGNPMFSLMARSWFRAPIHDVYCGLRGFRKDFYERLEQRCTGMEFATEMIIKTSLIGGRIAELPITLHKDGRRAHAPHLKTLRDGWKTLRFFLMCSPKWLFVFPGFTLLALGALGYAVALPGLTIGGITFDVHTLLFASLSMICGYQSILFAILSTTFAVNEGLLPPTTGYHRFYHYLNLERGLAVGAAALLAGMALLISAVNQWRLVDFGHLDYPVTMRSVIPGALLTVFGVQTILFSFFVSLLGMARR